MISKELLNEVLGYETSYIKMVGTKLCFSCHIKGGSNINIYELAHKCKEWAFSYKFDFEIIRIKNVKNYGKIFIRIHTIHTNQCNGKEFYPFDREPEAIFKACQWILDNKENK